MGYAFVSQGEGEGEVAFFSAKRWDRRNRADLIESATPCHDAQVVGLYRGSNPLRLTILAAMSEDYTTAPQHLSRTRQFYFRELFSKRVHPSPKKTTRNDVCVESCQAEGGLLSVLGQSSCQGSKVSNDTILLYKVPSKEHLLCISLIC